MVISALGINKEIDTNRLGSNIDILCDAGRPSNFRQQSHNQLYAFDGGLFQWSTEVDLSPFNVTSKNQTWGCLGETLLLVLENMQSGHVGKNPAEIQYIDMLGQLASNHNIEYPNKNWEVSL